MGKRLIWAEDAIKALDALFVKQIRRFGYDSYEKADEKTQLVCDGISESIGCVLNLPSAQRWIPVTERLPEEDVEVLITYRYKEGEGDTSHAYIDITTYGQMYFGGNKVGDHKHWRQPFEYFTSNYEVVAWMQLPEPWKGEQE